MNVLDFFLLVILFGAGVFGYKRGVIDQFASLVTTVVSIGIALIFTRLLSPIVQRFLVMDSSSDVTLLDKWIFSVVSCCVLFLFSKIALSFFHRYFNRLAQFPFLRKLHRVGGIALALLHTLVMYLLLIQLCLLLPANQMLEIVGESFLGQAIGNGLPSAIDFMRWVLIG